MRVRNLKRLRQLCGLTQFELAAGSNVSIHRIAQAEQGRVDLADFEEALLIEELKKHWEWMRSLDPAGIQELTAEITALTNSATALLTIQNAASA